MYGKAFCVLIIVLILIYNLATGSVETVASSNTETLTSLATYGTLVQAGAAVITLGIMVWLGIRQNAMTRRQINIALFDKRYKLYRDFQKTMLIEEPPYIHSGDEQKQYCHKCEDRINHFISEIEYELLFGQSVCDYIEDTEIMFSAFLKKMRDPKIIKNTVGYSEDYFNECNKAYDDLLKKIQESTEVFKPYLDFSKI